MATWDNKEKEVFKIDSEALKNDIDAIQSEKIEMLREELINTKELLEKNSADNLNASHNALEALISKVESKHMELLRLHQFSVDELYRINKNQKSDTVKALRISAFFISLSIIQGVILWLKLKGN